MPIRRVVSYYPVVVLACSLILVGIFAGPQIVDFCHGQADSVGHIESVSLSLYGRFHGAALVTDAYSGEFPTFYNFVSDWLINLIAFATGLPAFQTQAVIYVPFLTVLLFAGTYLSVRAVEADRAVALFAAVLLVGSAETPFVHYLYPLVQPLSGLSAATGNLIPPAPAIGVASSQVLGWALFLPVLSSLYCAKRKGGWLLPFFAGALLGISCLVHTLTFLHLGTSVSVYVAVDAIVTCFRRGRTAAGLIRLLALGVLTIGVALVSLRTGVSMVSFAVYWCTCFAISLIDRRSFYFSAVYGSASVLLAAPYILQIWQLGLQSSVFSSFDSPLPKTDFVLFYLAYIACAVVLFINARRLGRADSLIWLAVMLVVSIGMGYGKIFGFQSHEYRFLTNALIPFAVISAFVLVIPSSASRKIAMSALVPLLLIGVVRNLWAIAAPLPKSISQTVGAFQNYNAAIPLPPGAKALLDRLGSETATMSPGSRLLVPPEYQYPQQAYRNGLLLAVSHVPSFIPDPRYILWQDLYADRVAVFCGLFPTYPHLDVHTQTRVCDQIPKELAPGHLTLLDDHALLGVLPLYRIELLALLRTPLDTQMAERAAALGMKPIYNIDGGMLWRATTGPDPDRLSFGAATYREPDFSIPVVAPQDGSYLVVLAGKAISSHVHEVRLGEMVIAPRPLGDDAIALSLELRAGISQLTLVLAADRRLRVVFPAPVRSIVGVRRAVAQKFLTGPSLEELLR